ncbi:response regulator transcription factor [Lachnospiraceae bacterium 38-10]
MPYRILLAEDDPILRNELKVLLENAMYQVAAPDTFDRIPQTAANEKADLVLLDINLNGSSGFDICTQLRQGSDTPVIFLTGRTDSMDELTGMLKGADDYITKPFLPAILLARISAVLKRTSKAEERRSDARFSHRGAELDIAACRLTFGGRNADLTKTEMKILHLLFLRPDSFVAREDLMEYLWENRIFLDDNTLSVHVTRLRDKLKTIGLHDFIETKRGLGYRI